MNDPVRPLSARGAVTPDAPVSVLSAIADNYTIKSSFVLFLRCNYITCFKSWNCVSDAFPFYSPE